MKTIFHNLDLFIAFRYLRPLKDRSFFSLISFFSLLGITLGVATLIIVMSVMNGFRYELMDKILGFNSHIAVYNYQQHIEKYDTIADSLSEIDGVIAVRSILTSQSLVVADDTSLGVIVKGMNSKDLSSKKTISENLLINAIDEFDNDRSVIIGYKLALSLGVDIGDSVKLIAAKGLITPFGVTPRIVNFKVVDVYNVGMSEYDSSFLFMNLRNSQAFFNLDSKVTEIEIDVVNPMKVEKTMEVISSMLPARFSTIEWIKNHKTFFDALIVERNVMFIILTLIILVAAFNILSSLIILVRSKTREIAILRSLGFRKANILRIFFFSGGFVGFLGTILGLLLGVVFVRNIQGIKEFFSKLVGFDIFPLEIYFLSEIPARINYFEVMSVVVMSLVITVFATIIPSIQASNLNTVRGLKNE